MARGALAVLLLAGACSSEHAGPAANTTGSTPVASGVRSMSVTPVFGALTVGDTLRLRLAIDTFGTAGSAVRWTSSDSAALAISANGQFRAIAQKPIVQACAVSLYDAAQHACATLALRPAPLTAPHVDIWPAGAVMWSGDTLAFTATVVGGAGTPQSVTWSVTDTTQATVSSSGALFTKGSFLGPDSICATAVANTNLRGCAWVMHEPPRDPLVSWMLYVGPGSLTLPVGGHGTFYAFVQAPPGAAALSVTWSSADTTKVTVDGDGNVTARASTSGLKVCAQPVGKPFWAQCAVVVVP